MKNTENLIKGPGVVASVAGFGWWTASDDTKEPTFQIWFKLVRNIGNLIKGPGFVSVVAVAVLSDNKS